MAKRTTNIVYQFRIELREIEPTIWRVIQVPSEYSFWDLHVAIQDAMGWLDYHLHTFRFRMPHKRKDTEIGIPDDEFSDHEVLPGWKIPIIRYFTEPGKSAIYNYDYGDNWLHYVLLEGILLKEKGVKYPLCIGGERACPPEDCGGVSGYYELLKILSDRDHPEYEDYIEWLKGHAKNYFPYEPNNFDPGKVAFWDPKKRWKIAFLQ
jgi:hypothetical protein